jgi:hypothetical protein
MVCLNLLPLWESSSTNVWFKISELYKDYLDLDTNYFKLVRDYIYLEKLIGTPICTLHNQLEFLLFYQHLLHHNCHKLDILLGMYIFVKY